MASFWRENQLVWTKEKNSLKESTWFGEPKCKLGFQLAHFFNFKKKIVFFYPCCSITVRIKAAYMNWGHCWEHTNSPIFLSILELTWLTLWILARWLIERMHFQPFPSAQNGGENRKLKKLWKNRRRREKRPDVNLILSHVNHTFWYWILELDPQAFRYTYCTLRKNLFLIWRKVRLKVQVASNWSLGF
jgi:hypothetical protein